MRLYRAKVPTTAKDILQQLIAAGDIEVSNVDEAELDIQSVLNEYIRLERQITEETKDMLEQRGLPHGQFGKVKRMVADKHNVGLGQDGVTWMCNQILEVFMESNFVEEIFSSDAELRRRMREILQRHMMVDSELDEEVRRKILNMQEGSQQWDVEYAKVMEQIRRKRGLDQ